MYEPKNFFLGKIMVGLKDEIRLENIRALESPSNFSTPYKEVICMELPPWLLRNTFRILIYS